MSCFIICYLNILEHLFSLDSWEVTYIFIGYPGFELLQFFLKLGNVILLKEHNKEVKLTTDNAKISFQKDYTGKMIHSLMTLTIICTLILVYFLSKH